MPLLEQLFRFYFSMTSCFGVFKCLTNENEVDLENHFVPITLFVLYAFLEKKKSRVAMHVIL